MKLLSKKREQGSVLVIAMITGLAIGIVLASFLTLISSRYKLTMRSTAWNAAMPVLEAGIEEALAHAHKDPMKPYTDGWTATVIGGQTVHTKTRKLPDGSYFYVALYNANSATPVIYSSGFTPSPLEKDKYIARLVRVGTTNPLSMFVRAITTTQNVKLNGSVLVDGYDSLIGGYNASTNRYATGAIATRGSVDVQNANVYGNVTSGPGGTINVLNGAIGDVAWNASNTGAQPGWTNNNFNAAFPVNTPPSGGPFLSPVITSVGGSNIMYLATGTNQTTSLSLSQAKDPMIVTGNATLWVTGDVTLSGTGIIVIMPGASLKLYIGGVAKIAGGGVLNGTGLASQFSLIGLPGNTSITYSGNYAFIGTINAPQADVEMNGTPELYGAVLAKSFYAVGVSAVHYDEALATATGLVVTSWKEL